MSKRVALYTRVSTQDQSPEMQLRDLKEYAKARGFGDIKEYIDHGVSGTKEKRPALNELMKDARKRKIDVILVWRFDRFARSTKHLITALEEFQNLGVDFISYNENIDTTSPLGKAMFTIVSAMGEMERNLIVQRVKAGLANAKAKGTKLGRPSVLTDEILDDIRRLRQAGDSLRKISKQVGVGLGTVQKALELETA